MLSLDWKSFFCPFSGSVGPRSLRRRGIAPCLRLGLESLDSLSESQDRGVGRLEGGSMVVAELLRTRSLALASDSEGRKLLAGLGMSRVGVPETLLVLLLMLRLLLLNLLLGVGSGGGVLPPQVFDGGVQGGPDVFRVGELLLKEVDPRHVRESITDAPHSISHVVVGADTSGRLGHHDHSARGSAVAASSDRSLLRLLDFERIINGPHLISSSSSQALVGSNMANSSSSSRQLAGTLRPSCKNCPDPSSFSRST